jgi:nicotinamide/nicotinate riboside kinase
VVGISGCSCSGKTTLSENLKLKLVDMGYKVHLIGQDQYYLPDSQIPKDPITGFDNWDTPEAINMDEFYNAISHFIDNFEQSEPVKTVLIVEGFLYFHDEKFLKLIDNLIFTFSDFDALLERRNSREGYETIEGFWKDPENYFELSVYPSYLRFYKNIHESVQLSHNSINSQFMINYQSKNIFCLDSGKLTQQEMLNLAVNYIFN